MLDEAYKLGRLLNDKAEAKAKAKAKPKAKPEAQTQEEKAKAEADIYQPSKLRLFIVVFLINMDTFMMGTTIAWCSPIMPKIRFNFTDNPMEEPFAPQKQGWVFSLMSVGAFTSALFINNLIQTIGHKRIIILSTSMYAAGYCIMYMAKHFHIIYLGRYVMVIFNFIIFTALTIKDLLIFVLRGLGAGLTMTSIPIYLNDISTKASKSCVGNSVLLFSSMGMLFVYCVGPYTPYRDFQVCCVCAGIFSLVGYTYIPESPIYLVKTFQVNNAIKALHKLRGQRGEEIEQEITEIRSIIDYKKNLTKESLRHVIKSPAYRRAYTIAMGLVIFQMFSGALIMVVNSEMIFIEANSSVEPDISAIIVGCFQCLATLFVGVAINRFKRKTVLMTSATGMCISQLSIGTYFYFQWCCDASAFAWLPLVASILFQICFRIGFGTLPSLITAEIITPNLMAFVATSTTLTRWVIGVLIGKSYPVIDHYGERYVFWICGGCNALAILFVHFVVIETKGLTSLEIQKRLL